MTIIVRIPSLGPGSSVERRSYWDAIGDWRFAERYDHLMQKRFVVCILSWTCMQYFIVSRTLPSHRVCRADLVSWCWRIVFPFFRGCKGMRAGKTFSADDHEPVRRVFQSSRVLRWEVQGGVHDMSARAESQIYTCDMTLGARMSKNAIRRMGVH